jgi:hypothetical protein
MLHNRPAILMITEGFAEREPEVDPLIFPLCKVSLDVEIIGQPSIIFSQHHHQCLCI